MDHIGIDVHKRGSQIYMLAEGGEVVEQRIRTEPERFAAMLGRRPRARTLIEASTDWARAPQAAEAALPTSRAASFTFCIADRDSRWGASRCCLLESARAMD